MKKVSEQFKNFASGITSELRTEYEIPKFARLWNFDVSESRAIQHHPLRNLNSGEGFLLPHGGANPLFDNADATQNWDLNNQAILIQKNLDYSYPDLSLNGDNGSETEMQDGELMMSVVPVLYNDYIVYMTRDPYARIYFHDPYANESTRILSDVSLSSNTFFQIGSDGILYIFSGSSVHTLEFRNNNGNFNVDSQLSKYQPITQYMKYGDRDGSPGTYSGEDQILTDVNKAQSILKILGYYNGPVDGIYGPEFRDAVEDFQEDYNSTGNIPGGQSEGQSLADDGIIGPETTAVLNATDGYNDLDYRVRTNVLNMPFQFTAVGEHGGYIVFATQNFKAESEVFFWDRSLDANGKGDVGLITSVMLGNGVCQCLNTLEGQLIAIMSPSTIMSNHHKYNKLRFYRVSAGFDMLPASAAHLISEYRVLNKGGESDDDEIDNMDNYINQQTVVKGGRLYFSGRLHFQTSEDVSSDEGAMSGIFSIDTNGNLVPELFESRSSRGGTYDEIISFITVGEGFCISGDSDTWVSSPDTDETTSSGVITKIISGGKPWEDKKLDSIFIGLDDTAGLTNIKVFTREVQDVHEQDGGQWHEIYDGALVDTKFNNRLILRRDVEEDEEFREFRELQVMVKIFGTKCELTNLTVNYTMKESK